MAWDDEPGVPERPSYEQRMATVARLQSEIAESKADIEHRRLRERYGEEPKMWKVPEPEPSAVRNEVEAQVKAEGDRLRREFKAELDDLAEAVGEVTSPIERGRRAIEDKLAEHVARLWDAITEQRTAREVEIDALKQRVAVLEAGHEDVIPKFLRGANGDAALN